MKDIFDEIIEAIGDEKDGYKEYEELMEATKATHPEISKKFEMIAMQEKEHYNTLKDILKAYLK